MKKLREKILNDNLKATKETNPSIFCVSIRVADKNGEYIQVLELVKRDGKYLVNKIEYDT